MSYYMYVTDLGDKIFTSKNWVNTTEIKGLTVPVKADINQIKPGDRLKICNTRERFYVLIEDINYTDGEVSEIITRLTTHLVYKSPYVYGDYIVVKPENIYEIVKYEYFENQVKNYIAKIESGDTEEIIKALQNPTELVDKYEN